MIKAFSKAAAALFVAGGLVSTAAAQVVTEQGGTTTQEPMVEVDAAYTGVCTKDDRDTILVQSTIYASESDLAAKGLDRDGFVAAHRTKVYEHLDNTWKGPASQYSLSEIYGDAEKQQAFLKSAADKSAQLFEEFETETGLTVRIESFVVSNQPGVCDPL